MARSVSWFRSWLSMFFVMGILVLGATGCFGEATGESYTPPTEEADLRATARAKAPTAAARSARLLQPSARAAAVAR
jgi:hypothetical protein